MRRFFWASVLVLALSVNAHALEVKAVNSIPSFQWQKEASFPDWKGYTDDTLAMNSITGFTFWHGQGSIYINVAQKVKSFRLYVNGHEADTSSIEPGGVYEMDISDSTVNGINTLQVSNIEPYGLNGAVRVFIPYPVILEGRAEDEGIRPEALELIADIISSDIAHGFSSAQLAVIRNGRMVYSNAWGKTNTDNPQSPEVTRSTLYDLASVSKVLAGNFALQKLAADGLLDIDMDMPTIFGTSAKSLRGITVRDLMCHRAGFPPEIHYHDKHFDITTRKHNANAINPLYTGMDGSQQTRANTLQAILKTPLTYRPRSKIVYSDIDYMLLSFVAERISGKRLDEYLAANFWKPMGLTRIAFNPLQNGFSAYECAASEIDGNTHTRGKYVNYEGLRKQTIQGEVHDEKAFHSMGGISAHAGLFANAEDCARLASVMLTGGYGGFKFFSRAVIDVFTSPQNISSDHWGIGWWREGDDKRPYYFGAQVSSEVFGHQGFTGTLVMIDPTKNLVIAYLTSKLNTPKIKPLPPKKIFAGNWYTASTLGFVPQLLYIGLDGDKDKDISGQLRALLEDMTQSSRKLIPAGAGSGHAAMKNYESKLDVLRLWKDRKDREAGK